MKIEKHRKLTQVKITNIEIFFLSTFYQITSQVILPDIPNITSTTILTIFLILTPKRISSFKDIL